MTPTKKTSATARRRPRCTVVKLGGELVEEPRRRRAIARQLVATSVDGPLVVVHGGGREIDADMARLGIAKQAVDGLRITDAPTLDVVLGVLAGRVNMRLVATLGSLGGSAVGLTGVDASLLPVRRARRYRATDGSSIDLGFVGVPETGDPPALVHELLRGGYIPVVASLGADRHGHIYNVNADTLAGALAASLGARRLVIAGTTAGVLDAAGATIAEVDDGALRALIEGGQASAGMVAKLMACQAARAGGVRQVTITDGTRRGFLDESRTTGVTTVTTQTRSARRVPAPTGRGVSRKGKGRRR